MTRPGTTPLRAPLTLTAATASETLPMMVDLPFFLLAVVLLLFPRAWMRLGWAFLRRRRRGRHGASATEPWLARQPGDPRLSFRREFTRLRNYIDLLRA